MDSVGALRLGARGRRAAATCVSALVIVASFRARAAVLTVGTGKDHLSIQSCVDAALPGDECVVDPGTFPPAVLSHGGDASGDLVVRAAHPVWDCPSYDPDTNPYADDCSRNTSQVTTITGPGSCFDITADGLSHIRILGFDLRCADRGVRIDSSSAADVDEVEVAFNHFEGGSPASELLAIDFGDVDGSGWSLRVHHDSFYEPLSDGTGGVGTDYGIQLYRGSDAWIHNIWCGTAYNHCLSLKRYVGTTTIELFHVEGGYDGIYLGQNADDPGSPAGPACGSDNDSTSGPVRIDWLFVRATDDPLTAHPLPRQPLRIHNAHAVVASNVFISEAQRGLLVAKEGSVEDTLGDGLCGELGEDVELSCAIVTSPQEHAFELQTRGIEDDTITLRQLVSVAPGLEHLAFRNMDNYAGFPAHCGNQQTCDHPFTEWQRGIFVAGAAVADGDEIASRTSDHDNDYFGVPSRDQPGDTAMDPQLVGPLSVPHGQGVPTLDWHAIESWARRFDTTNDTLVAEGKGTNDCFRLPGPEQGGGGAGGDAAGGASAEGGAGGAGGSEAGGTGGDSAGGAATGGDHPSPGAGEDSGCGCVLVGEAASPPLSWLLGLSLALGVRRRRRDSYLRRTSTPGPSAAQHQAQHLGPDESLDHRLERFHHRHQVGLTGRIARQIAVAHRAAGEGVGDESQLPR